MAAVMFVESLSTAVGLAAVGFERAVLRRVDEGAMAGRRRRRAVAVGAGWCRQSVGGGRAWAEETSDGGGRVP